MRILLLIMVLFTSCMNVKTLVYSKADFEKYNSFCWVDGCEANYDGPDYIYNSEKMSKIKNAIHQQLLSKGLDNNLDDPELLVNFHIVISEEASNLAQIPDNSTSFDEYESFWDNYQSPFSLNENSYKYLKTLLVIDVLEVKTGRVIWQSRTKRNFNLNENLSDAQIEKGASSALRKLPSFK